MQTKEIKAQFAADIGSFLIKEKKMVETLLKSQLSTDKPKYLELFSPECTTRVYTQAGEICSIVNSNRLTDRDALQELNLTTLSFDDVVSNQKVKQTIQIQVSEFQNLNNNNKLNFKNLKSGFSIVNDSPTPLAKDLPLPKQDLIDYILGINKIFKKSLLEPKTIKFNYESRLKVTINMEPHQTTITCN